MSPRSPQIGDKVRYLRGLVPGAVWTVVNVFEAKGAVMIQRSTEGTFPVRAWASVEEIELVITGKED